MSKSMKYCSDFTFPKDFGFSGSAEGRADSRSHPQRADQEYGDGLAKGGQPKKMAMGGIPRSRSTVPGISHMAPSGAAPQILAAVLKSPMVRAAAAAARQRKPQMPQVAGAAPTPVNPVPGMAKGGHITAKQRRALPSSDFALPGKGSGPEGKGSGSYPIDTPGRARSALSRASANASPAQQATIRRKVHSKYPSIKVSNPSGR